MFRRDNGAETHSDICYLELQPDGGASEPKTYLATKANETMPKLSPDGRFLAYVSDELGRNEVYVRPFPEAAGEWRVSDDGGAQPRWRADGRELYYVEDGTALMAVPVSTETDFTLGKPQRLFASPDLKTDGSRAAPGYDVSADGQLFLTVAPLTGQGEADPAKIRVVQNWLQEFRNR